MNYASLQSVHMCIAVVAILTVRTPGRRAAHDVTHDDSSQDLCHQIWPQSTNDAPRPPLNTSAQATRTTSWSTWHVPAAQHNLTKRGHTPLAGGSNNTTTPQHQCRQQPEQRHQPPDMVQLAATSARPSCAKSPACSTAAAGTRCICCIDRFPRAVSRYVAASAISHPYTSWHLVALTSCSAAPAHSTYTPAQSHAAVV